MLQAPHDVIVIGGGIVGLATAYRLSGHYPGKKIAVVEKEAGLARHQTGHNSGVLHSGIYYKPGSMKAATCRAGREAMIAFCDREGIAYDLCGKVIVAYPGFFHLARRHWRMGMGEMWRSWNKAAFVRALQRLMPEITAEHLDPAPAGVRAQAITPDGKLLDDFAFSKTRRIVHVVNAPSPAATASLSIDEFIAAKVAERF